MGTAAAVTVAVFVTVMAVLHVLDRRTRSRPSLGKGAPVLGAHEAAFLSGGPLRVVDTALAALAADGRVEIGGPGIVTPVADAEGRAAGDPVHRAVLDTLDASPNGSLPQLRAQVARHRAVQGIGDDLASRGLLQPPSRAQDRLWSAGSALATLSVLTMIASLVVTVLSHELDWDRPPLPFALLVVPVTIVAMLQSFSLVSRYGRRITYAGTNTLEAYRIRTASSTDPAVLVALGGPGALPGESTTRVALVAAAVVPVVLLGAVAAGTAGGGTGGEETAASAQWCGGGTGYGGSSDGSGGGDGGGDGGGGDGGGCGGCGGCGCG
ncbi:TIGR04222 domain-containing membrane protein [Streptomyces yaizuensis]|uniref:TIGR04222 domain-containing membrane protein n=1 Tax=Streptomyces yaizuensis TaxID=2989713 RepID=A0ABQ5P6D9_9ACTN|nr:TIGR04222 domain-containing membrane protein [Streptomyces sp. YSPA8]GLF97791.1 TIGR04222 domain-containing membrane protein [Streptomyces sp. YSPA8]